MRNKSSSENSKQWSTTNNTSVSYYMRITVHVYVCCWRSRSVITCQVLIHHIWAVFHKETEHGGATGPALQPQQDWSFVLVCLSVRASHRKERSQHHPVVTSAYQQKVKKTELTTLFLERTMFSLGLHDMRKICDNIVECRDNDITCDKWTVKCINFCLSAAKTLI